jgi:hypothetical protein
MLFNVCDVLQRGSLTTIDHYGAGGMIGHCSLNLVHSTAAGSAIKNTCIEVTEGKTCMVNGEYSIFISELIFFFMYVSL